MAWSFKVKPYYIEKSDSKMMNGLLCVEKGTWSINIDSKLGTTDHVTGFRPFFRSTEIQGSLKQLLPHSMSLYAAGKNGSISSRNIIHFVSIQILGNFTFIGKRSET